MKSVADLRLFGSLLRKGRSKTRTSDTSKTDTTLANEPQNEDHASLQTSQHTFNLPAGNKTSMALVFQSSTLDPAGTHPDPDTFMSSVTILRHHPSEPSEPESPLSTPDSPPAKHKRLSRVASMFSLSRLSLRIDSAAPRSYSVPVPEASEYGSGDEEDGEEEGGVESAAEHRARSLAILSTPMEGEADAAGRTTRSYSVPVPEASGFGSEGEVEEQEEEEGGGGAAGEERATEHRAASLARLSTPLDQDTATTEPPQPEDDLITTTKSSIHALNLLSLSYQRPLSFSSQRPLSLSLHPSFIRAPTLCPNERLRPLKSARKFIQLSNPHFASSLIRDLDDPAVRAHQRLRQDRDAARRARWTAALRKRVTVRVERTDRDGRRVVVEREKYVFEERERDGVVVEVLASPGVSRAD